MSRAGEPAIAAAGVRKAFGETVVLDGVDFTVDRGHDLRPARAQRGRPDDDGRILATLIPADAGEVRDAGSDVTVRARTQFGDVLIARSSVPNRQGDT
jgi:ABC-2 type transport system ATP-binding protein